MQLSCFVFLVVFLCVTQVFAKKPMRSYYLRRADNDRSTNTKKYNNGYVLTGLPKLPNQAEEYFQNNARRDFLPKNFSIDDRLTSITLEYDYSITLNPNVTWNGSDFIPNVNLNVNLNNHHSNHHHNSYHSEEDYHSDQDMQHHEMDGEKDLYTYVALIDTFLKNKYLQPELTFSFVVIGTKNMFATGYERYLPIEKVLTHPRFKVWTADLALVFTFANMVANNPGQIVPLASSRSQDGRIDTNMTVLSWGLCSSDEDAFADNDYRKHQNQGNSPTTDNSKENTQNDRKQQTYPDERSQQSQVKLQEQEDALVLENTRPIFKNGPPFSRRSMNELRKRHVQHFFDLQDYDDSRSLELRQGMTGIPKTNSNRRSGTGKNPKSEFDSSNGEEIAQTNPEDKDVAHDSPQQSRKVNSRSKTGKQRNQNLTIGEFGFVNIDTCKRNIERSLPPMYEIKNKSEYFCYTSEELFITNEDSGAPVLQLDELVAITVGGVGSEGDHLAIGIKLACFCTWIAKQLQKYGGSNLNCCRCCCDDNLKSKKKHTREGSHEQKIPIIRKPARARFSNVHYNMKLADNYESKEDLPNKEIKEKSDEDNNSQEKADESGAGNAKGENDNLRKAGPFRVNQGEEDLDMQGFKKLWRK